MEFLWDVEIESFPVGGWIFEDLPGEALDMDEQTDGVFSTGVEGELCDQRADCVDNVGCIFHGVLCADNDGGTLVIVLW